MTLIITAYANGHTFQVSDRVLSVFRGGGATPVWAYANKSLVLRTVDAAVVLGFTGIAYLRGMPTDRWITDQLLLDLDGPSGPYVGLGNQTLSDVVAVLRKRLPRAIATSRRPAQDGLLLRPELGGQKFDRRWPNGTSPFAISMEFWGRSGLVAPTITSHQARAALRRGIESAASLQ